MVAAASGYFESPFGMLVADNFIELGPCIAGFGGGVMISGRTEWPQLAASSGVLAAE